MSTATNASPVRTARPIVTLSPSLSLTQRCCYTRPHSATRADGRTANVKVRSPPPSPSFRCNGSPNDDRRPSDDSLLLRAAAWLHARRHRERERRTGKGRGPQNQAPCVCGRELNRFGRQCSMQPAHVPIIDTERARIFGMSFRTWPTMIGCSVKPQSQETLLMPSCTILEQATSPLLIQK